MPDKEFEHIISERFTAYGSVPNDSVWNGISNALDQDQKRKGAFWWYFAALITLAAISYVSFPTGTHKEQLPGTSEVKATTPNGPSSQREISNKKRKENTTTGRTTETPVAITFQNNADPEEKETDNVQPKEDSFDGNQPIPVREEREIPQLTERFTPLPAGTFNLPQPSPQQLRIVNAYQPKPETDRLWAAGVRATGFVALTDPELLNPVDPTTSSFVSDPSAPTLPVGHPYQRRFFEAELFIRRKFNRFEAGSGGFYSWDRNSRQPSDSVLIITNRNNFGIPLNLRYNVLSMGKFNFNVELGGLYEFTKGSVVYYELKEIDPTQASITQSDPGAAFATTINGKSFTGHAIAGDVRLDISYTFNNRLSLFAGAGYRHYFFQKDNTTEITLRRPEYLTYSVGVFKRF